MKIIQLTPGSGETFYCENCLRDLSLVRGLRSAGHDVTLVPMYLPLSAEARGPRNVPLFFGGINVFLQQKSAFFRSTPRWFDRILDSRWLLRLAGRRAGMTAPADLADATLSMLRGEDGRQAKELHRLTQWLRHVGRPNVVLLSNALLLGMARPIKRALGMAVVCWLQDEDGFVDALGDEPAEKVWNLLRQLTADVDGFLAASRYYGDYMHQRLAISSDRIAVVHEAVDPEAFAPASAPPTPPAVGFLNHMGPSSGLDLLAEAFVRLKADGRFPDLRLHLAGGRNRNDDPYLSGIRSLLADAGCLGDVEFHGNPLGRDKVNFLRSLSVLSVPQRRPAAGGLYAMEAMACGVPVVQPDEGVFPELIAATGGGVLCKPRDIVSLADALAGLLADPPTAQRLGRAGRTAVFERFSIARGAERLIAALRTLPGERHAQS